MASTSDETPPHADHLLVAAELVAGYVPEVNILDGVNLTLSQDEIVGIIGPNGAGKSTLVKTIFGLIPTRSGQVLLRGKDISAFSAHQLVSQGVGYVPQTQNVFATLTVQENLEMGIYLRHREFGERYRYVTQLFPLLDERRRQKAGSLSGGERQMLAMGRALMMDPSVLLLDEPTAGLSPKYQDEVFDQVRRINDAGIAIVMVEQNAQRCLEISNRAYVLHQGRNAVTGRGVDLLNDANVIECYLGTLAHSR